MLNWLITVFLYALADEFECVSVEMHQMSSDKVTRKYDDCTSIEWFDCYESSPGVKNCSTA